MMPGTNTTLIQMIVPEKEFTNHSGDKARMKIFDEQHRHTVSRV